jgi:hypothetical protein
LKLEHPWRCALSVALKLDLALFDHFFELIITVWGYKR